MAALATVADVAARIGRTFTAEEEARVEALLTDASAAVRAYTGQTFDLVEDEEVRLRARNGAVKLPQRPVTGVAGVTSVDGDTVAFEWDHSDLVYVTGLNPYARFDVEPFRSRDPWLDVTYTHGYATVPEDIVAVVCQIVGRAFGRPADATAVTQESIAGYSYSIGGAAAQGPLGLMQNEREALDRYRRPVGTIRVGL